MNEQMIQCVSQYMFLRQPPGSSTQMEHTMERRTNPTVFSMIQLLM